MRKVRLMSVFGGAYIEPLTFFSDVYAKNEFNQKTFWENEQKSWGTLAQTFSHESNSAVIRSDARHHIVSTSDILLSTDGLMATEVPNCAATNEEALVILSCHLSSFLSLLNFGGTYFSPISEKDIAHVSFDNNTLTQISGGGDEFSSVTLERALHRNRIPYRMGTPLIDFNWVAMRILSDFDIKESFNLGSLIVDKLDFSKTESILALEAYANYTAHKWRNALLLGWAFIEILIDKLWKVIFLSTVLSSEKNRKDRLEDNRTYSASVKTEMLYSRNLINLETYNKLNSLRSLRNGIVHEGRTAFQNEVSQIFFVIGALVNIVTDLEPRFNDPGWTRSGGWVQGP